jgi:hypothetical protein
MSLLGIGLPLALQSHERNLNLAIPPMRTPSGVPGDFAPPKPNGGVPSPAIVPRSPPAPPPTPPSKK